MNRILYYSILFFSITSFSQSQEDCPSNLSIFAEYAKVKNYNAAYQPWINVKESCPDINSAIYVYGERILKDFIKKSDASDKIKYEKDLLELYDQWLAYFPISKRGKNETGCHFYDL